MPEEREREREREYQLKHMLEKEACLFAPHVNL
jgi:hypothetical protein